MNSVSQSQPSGEVSADAEIFAGLNVEQAAASIAHLVDEYTDRGWDDDGRAKFAAIIRRRLRRFAASPPAVAPTFAEEAPGHTDLMVTPESIAPWIVRDTAARTICDFMGWPEDGPAFDDAIKLAELLGFKLFTESPTHILLHALRELLATCDSDDEAFRGSGKRLAEAAIAKALGAATASPAERPAMPRDEQ